MMWTTTASYHLKVAEPSAQQVNLFLASYAQHPAKGLTLAELLHVYLEQAQSNRVETARELRVLSRFV